MVWYSTVVARVFFPRFSVFLRFHAELSLLSLGYSVSIPGEIPSPSRGFALARYWVLHEPCETIEPATSVLLSWLALGGRAQGIEWRAAGRLRIKKYPGV